MNPLHEPRSFRLLCWQARSRWPPPASTASNPKRSPPPRTTSPASSPARRDPKRACGSSPRRRELPTKFVKIVVTDDRGRYVIPELPKATYSVWVRGYGLVDSPKRRRRPGTTLNLTAVAAPNAQAAAQYYPAGYWYSLHEDPGQERVPGHRRRRATASRRA